MLAPRKFFRAKLAAAGDLSEIEIIADSLLTATRASADARAELVAIIRKRIAAAKKPDPTHVDALLALLAKHDFRDAGRIGEWKGDQLAEGGEKTLEWEFTPLLARTTGECVLHLDFRWTGGAPLVLKAVAFSRMTGSWATTQSRKPRILRYNPRSPPCVSRNRSPGKIHRARRPPRAAQTARGWCCRAPRQPPLSTRTGGPASAAGAARKSRPRPRSLPAGTCWSSTRPSTYADPARCSWCSNTTATGARE